MTSMTEGYLSLKLCGEEENRSSNDPVVAILFFGICLVLGIALKHLLRGSKVPYTVALLVIGVVIGFLEYGSSLRLGKVGAGIRLWAKIDPDLLLAIFLPPLLFESAFSMEWHHIKSCMVQMFLLAGPGVFISSFLLGSALKLAFPYGWTWNTSLLLGVTLSATDPVAVVALLKELGARKNLTTIIEGESMMNDGVAVVLFYLFHQMVLGQKFGVGAIVKYLIQVCTGAVGIGLAFGLGSFFWLGFVFNDTIIEIVLTLAVSYTAYFTAQGGAGVSGILTIMTLGILYSAVSRTALKGDGQQSFIHSWELVAFIGNTLIFILSGVLIAEGILDGKNYWENHETSWGYLILLYVCVQLTRVIVVMFLYPLLRYFGSGLNWKEATVVAWSGLRGPVSLSLALSVKGSSDGFSILDRDTRNLFIFFTGGIVFLTIIVNGSTTECILHLLHMLSGNKLSEEKRRALDYAKYEMMNKALEAFVDLNDNEELGPSDWFTVKNYLPCLNNLEVEQVHPRSLSESENKLDGMELKETRIRLLNGVQAAYWRMLEEGSISQTTAKVMMQSVHDTMDLVSLVALCDWKELKSHVHFPSYYKILQKNFCPQTLVTYFMVEGLQSGCYICAAFLHAHRIARRQLHDFLGESDNVYLVIRESEAEGKEARKFLNDVRVIFPQVLHVVKTRQITYSILKQLSDYVLNLEKVGILEETEITHLQDAVQTDLKKLLRSPPLLKMPNTIDTMRNHPFIGALPAMFCETLIGSATELTELPGVSIYGEGINPSGIWLISNGLVKWTSRSLSTKQSLHPIFSHGSSLGLYEVLNQKPYICNMVTDTVVDCFFIKAEHIFSLLRSDPMVESFLWQETVIVIAKLLLPEVYEKIPTHELRALVVDKSMMNIYRRGEIIVIPNHSVGFLLEGSVTSQEVPKKLIPAPEVLLPPRADFHSLKAEQSGILCTESGYLVETRARVIIFDLAAVEGHKILQKQHTSLVSRLVDYPGYSREHSALMSWPEYFDVPRRRQQYSEVTGLQANSLSARALQLSIFGNMVPQSLSHPTAEAIPHVDVEAGHESGDNNILPQ